MNFLKKKHFPLLAVFIIFVVPLIAGTFLYYFHNYFNFKTLNHGVLVTPPIVVPYLNPTHQKKWKIIYVANDVCDEQCKKIDFQLHQVQKVLGKNSRRADVFMFEGKSKLIAVLNDGFLQQDKNFNVKDKIYLVDPLDNLFMYYPSNANPMDILKDLKRVLEVSQIG